MEKTSVWKVSSEEAPFPALSKDITVDVALIGGGITGITAAYLLAKAGKKVAVLEARKIGEGSTGYSTGNLYAMVGSEGLHAIRSKWDEDVLRQVLSSRAAAVDFLRIGYGNLALPVTSDGCPGACLPTTISRNPTSGRSGKSSNRQALLWLLISLFPCP